MHVRVDDPAYWLVAGDLLHFRNQLVGLRVGHRVHDEHTIVANLCGRVDAVADQHPDVALDVEGLHVGGRALTSRRGALGSGLWALGSRWLAAWLYRFGQRGVGAAAHLLGRQVVLLRVVAEERILAW